MGGDHGVRIALIIPALNEEESLPGVLEAVPKEAITEIVVVDNGSTDGTADAARRAGARVVTEQTRGYGAACWSGFQATEAEILVFMDGDGSFLPGEVSKLTDPILRDRADLVLGTRTGRAIDAGTIPVHARLGNKLASGMIRLASRLRTTDLGPFRAVRRETLRRLQMRERTYGWPSEMIIKAAKLRCRVLEVPVSYRPRTAGKSKVSGSVVGSVKAAFAMIRVIARWSLWTPGTTPK